MPDYGQRAVIERVFVCIPVGIPVVFCRGEHVLHKGGVEVEEAAAGKLVDHPCEGDVLDLLVGVAAAYVAVVPGEPALD